MAKYVFGKSVDVKNFGDDGSRSVGCWSSKERGTRMRVFSPKQGFESPVIANPDEDELIFVISGRLVVTAESLTETVGPDQYFQAKADAPFSVKAPEDTIAVCVYWKTLNTD